METTKTARETALEELAEIERRRHELKALYVRENAETNSAEKPWEKKPTAGSKAFSITMGIILAILAISIGVPLVLTIVGSVLAAIV